MTTQFNESAIPQATVSRSVAGVRLLVGLLQGLALYLVYLAAENKIWTADNSGLFAAGLLILTLIPVLLISGLGHLPGKTLWRWLLPLAVVLAFLGYYDIWRGIGAPFWDSLSAPTAPRYPSPELWLHAVAGVLIAQTLIVAANTAGQRIAAYRDYFETASKLLIQFAFAVVFVGLIWLVLNLGAELFKLIKLEFLKKLLNKSWFVIPTITFAFAYALHITDVRPAIVRGIRSLILVLLSWILPIAVLLIGGFLLALPFTGLAPLWATKSATALLLAASAVLVILINAAFQDGHVADDVALPIRLSARIAAVLLLPLALIAIYALSLRVGQYGWTVDRLVAAFYLVLASCFAFGYFIAALRSPQWLSRVGGVNVFTAFILLVLLLAIFSPVLDPARISVNSQLQHLRDGRIKADKFDYEYLRFQGKRYGNSALQALIADKSHKDAKVILLKANAALKRDELFVAGPQKIDSKLLVLNISVRTPDTVLPSSFITQNWQDTIKTESWRFPDCLYDSARSCEAYLLDLDADGGQEVLLRNENGPLHAFRLQEGAWSQVGKIALPQNCPAINEALRMGRVTVAPALLRDVVVAGSQFRLVSEVSLDCPKEPLAPTP